MQPAADAEQPASASQSPMPAISPGRPSPFGPASRCDYQLIAASEQRSKRGDRERVGQALLLGADRVLLRLGGRPCLAGREPKAVVAIPFDDPRHMR